MTPSKRLITGAGAFFGASGVLLGAFGAHALAGHLSLQQAGWWQTAVQYQLWHALALLLVAALAPPKARLTAALFGIGTMVFCGTLYLLALGAPRWLGAVTPVGGLLMIAGWLLLAWTALRPIGPTPRD